MKFIKLRIKKLKNYSIGMDFEIGKIRFGRKSPPVIIGEIGINHGGSLDVAKQMVKSASAAGLKIIKHQTHIIEDEMIPLAQKLSQGIQLSLFMTL